MEQKSQEHHYYSKLFFPDQSVKQIFNPAGHQRHIGAVPFFPILLFYDNNTLHEIN